MGHASSNNLVQVMLHGIQRVGTDSVMPGFADELSDVQIMTLGNYLLSNYGNPEAKVSEQQVAQLRDTAEVGVDKSLLALARVGLALGALVVLGILAWLLRRRKA